ncbi:MAG TPA: hypothetical protein VE010_06005 [Thermoanaerobaculia bacterium]|nr:hypothetical protein [Thermoanaerobaculia bacterium]
MKRTFAVLLALALLVPTLQSQPTAAPTSVPSVHSHDRVPLSDAEKVDYNVRSGKYHCRSCSSARACTANCITISRADAKRRGGVPCRRCGGSC